MNGLHLVQYILTECTDQFAERALRRRSYCGKRVSDKKTEWTYTIPNS